MSPLTVSDRLFDGIMMDGLLATMRMAVEAGVAEIGQYRRFGLEIREKAYRDYVTS